MSRALIFLLLLDAGSLRADGCPQTARAWDRWRKSFVAHLVRVEDLGLDGAQFLENCAKDPSQKKLFQDPALRACLLPLRAAIRSFHALRKPEPSVQRVPTDRYLQVSRVAFPELLQPPKEFLNIIYRHPSALLDISREAVARMTKGIGGDALRAAARYPGAKIVQKGHATLVLLPGEDYDRWMNIDGGLLMYITIQKRDAEHRPLSPPRAFFNSFTDPGAGPEAPTFDRFSGPMLCTECHRTGAMPVLRRTDNLAELVSPRPGKDVRTLAAAMNARIRRTAGAVPESVNLEGFGPPLGAIDPPERTAIFLESCANDGAKTFSKERLLAIGKAMNCERCHDGDDAGILSAPMASSFSSLVKGLLESGHMPPGSPLDMDERAALARCLTDEYYGGIRAESARKEPGALARYLLAKPCVLSAGPAHAGEVVSSH